MTDRLTAATARVGMRVRLAVPIQNPCGLNADDVYTIRRVDNEFVYFLEKGEIDGWWIDRFIPADEPPPQWATEELKRCCVTLHDVMNERIRSRAHVSSSVVQCMTHLLDAIEASGLLPKPPSTTAREASISGEWWV